MTDFTMGVNGCSLMPAPSKDQLYREFNCTGGVMRGAALGVFLVQTADSISVSRYKSGKPSVATLLGGIGGAYGLG
jgi:hypothetical protein